MPGVDKTATAAGGDRPHREDLRTLAVRFLANHGVTVILLVIITLMAFSSPAFLTLRNILNIVRQASVIGIVGIGVTLVIITTGIDLASGSVIALVSVVSASMAHPDQYPVVVPVVAGLATGALTGAISGTIVGVGKIPAFIATGSVSPRAGLPSPEART